MFESAEIKHAIDEKSFEEQLPALREALLEAQFELQQQSRFPVIILINGIEGAGKGETVKLLNEWMDPRQLLVGLALLAQAAAQGAYRHFLRQLVQPDAPGPCR